MTASPSTRRRLSARVTGRVQGVYFRAFTRRQAQKLGVTGWVRNEHDGSVRLEAEGLRAVLNRLLAALREGPPGARVDDVSVEWSEPTGAFDAFVVRY